MSRTYPSLRLAGASLFLAALLVGCQGEEQTSETPMDSKASGSAISTVQGGQGDAVAGKVLFEANCAACHGTNGEGVPGTFPPMVGTERVNGPADEHIKVVLNGLSGPITVKGEEYNGFMTPFKHLSDQEIADIITYKRTSWGNTGGAVTAEQVNALRD